MLHLRILHVLLRHWDRSVVQVQHVAPSEGQVAAQSRCTQVEELALQLPKLLQELLARIRDRPAMLQEVIGISQAHLLKFHQISQNHRGGPRDALHAVHQDAVLLGALTRLVKEVQDTVHVLQDIFVRCITQPHFLVHKLQATLGLVFREKLPDLLFEVHLLRQVQHVRNLRPNRELLVILQVPFASQVEPGQDLAAVRRHVRLEVLLGHLLFTSTTHDSLTRDV
mmetsp:Transcript_65332/g.143241  ORF Transcript_65332/g.143241 Transcript_65332/m.143241 type:complete len:225 (+) Transcript_65332:410-1084(+)